MFCGSDVILQSRLPFAGGDTFNRQGHRPCHAHKVAMYPEGVAPQQVIPVYIKWYALAVLLKWVIRLKTVSLQQCKQRPTVNWY